MCPPQLCVALFKSVARSGNIPRIEQRYGAHVFTCTARSPNMPTPAKILLVDDHKLVRQTLFLILAEQAHWEIYEAENGRVALDRIPEIKPDVVILDIMMPEMDGLEAGYKIRRLAPETRVILMSSHYTQQEAAVITRQFGDGNFLQKAELAKHLVPTISRLLREESQDALKVPRAVSDNA